MKTQMLLIFLLIVGTAFTSCKKNDEYVTPSGNITTESKAITGFNEINVSDQFTIYVTFADAEETVEVEADDNLQAYIHVSKNGNTLLVNLDDNINIQNGEATLKVHVSMKELYEIDGSGACLFQFQNELNGTDFEVELSGASALKGAMNLNQLDVNCDGGSSLDITGTTQIFGIETSGACIMEGYDFEVHVLETDLDGACEMSVTVHDKLYVRADGGSTVYYKGDGVIESQDLSGGSQIIKVE